MSILNDEEITELCVGVSEPMITPFLSEQVKIQEYKRLGDDDGERRERKVISYGLSSFGYDIRLNDVELKVFSKDNYQVVDPRKVNSGIYNKPVIHYDEDDKAPYVILPSNTGMLGHSVETFNIPRNVLVNALGKSTYARCFVSVIVTPLEPGWKGQLVIEVVNHSPLPVRVYLSQGICQLIFLRGEDCKVSYADRGGKYQNQSGTQDSLV